MKDKAPQGFEIPDVPKLCFSLPEAAMALGICLGGVYKLLKGNQLHAYKVGGRSVIRRNDLEAFMERLPRLKLLGAAK